jgi:hypothetical protein
MQTRQDEGLRAVSGRLLVHLNRRERVPTEGVLVTFYILLSTAAILATIVGGTLIWGFDMVRAREIERDARRRVPPPELPAATGHTELDARPAAARPAA